MKIGIDLGGSHIGMGLVNEEGKILEKYEVDLKKKEICNIQEFIINYICENISTLSKKYNVEAIGISSPGTPKNGKLTNLVNLGIRRAWYYRFNKCTL